MSRLVNLRTFIFIFFNLKRNEFVMKFIETSSYSKLYRCGCIVGDDDAKPYKILLDPGKYKIELWGASGGGHSIMPGKGGYATAFLDITNQTQFFLFVGGVGEVSNNKNASGGCNGGGNGYQGKKTELNYENGGGGGSTDLRTELDINSRILVASGGGGSSAHNGGDGGALIGFNGTGYISSDFNFSDSNMHIFGCGGTQNEGGEGGYYKDLYQALNGSLGAGSDAVGIDYSGGGGGSGYYGGGGSYESGGGGGSSYIDPTLDGYLKSGRESFPSPTKKRK